MRKQKADLPQGTLDLLVLKALSLGPMHGYGVGQRIQQLAEDMLTIEEGTLYPALYRIEQKGWIESDWQQTENNRRAKYYQLTAAGRKAVGAETASWRRYVAAVEFILDVA